MRGQDPESAQRLLALANNGLMENIGQLKNAASNSPQAVGVAARATADNIGQVPKERKKNSWKFFVHSLVEKKKTTGGQCGQGRCSSSANFVSAGGYHFIVEGYLRCRSKTHRSFYDSLSQTARQGKKKSKKKKGKNVDRLFGQDFQRNLVACAKDLEDALLELLNSARGINNQDLENAERALASEANRITRFF